MKTIFAIVLVFIALLAWLIVLGAPTWLVFVLCMVYGYSANRYYHVYREH